MELDPRGFPTGVSIIQVLDLQGEPVVVAVTGEDDPILAANKFLTVLRKIRGGGK